MTVKNVYLATGIESIDNLFNDKGIPVGNWVGFIGEPGSYKTLTCVQIAANYVLGTEDMNVIFISMEYPAETLEQHFYQMGYDPDEIANAIKKKRLSFVSEEIIKERPVFIDSYSKDVIANNVQPESIARGVQQISRSMKLANRGRVVLMIDGISRMWGKAPAMSRSIFGVLTIMLRDDIDIAFFTQQISIGTDKAFGWGTEHGGDTNLKFGKYYKDGYRQWIYIDKHRGGGHEKRLFDIYINKDKEIVVGDPIDIKGRFKDVSEALESLKYANKDEIQEKRNALLAEQNDLLKEIAGIMKMKA